MADVTAAVDLVALPESATYKGLQQDSTRLRLQKNPSELITEVHPVALPLSRAPCKGTARTQQ